MSRLKVGAHAMVACRSFVDNNGRIVLLTQNIGACSCGEERWFVQGVNGHLIGPFGIPALAIAYHASDLIPLDGDMSGLDEGSDVKKPESTPA